MTVKEALKEVFKFQSDYYSKNYGEYPKVPWSPNVNQKIYKGKKNLEGWICWRPMEIDTYISLNRIEKEIGIKIHESIKEYFNSFWFLELTIPYKNLNFSMTSNPPNEELKNVIEPWKACKENFRDNLYLSLGVEQNGKYSLLVNNKNGEVAIFNHDTRKVKTIFDSLAEFIYSPLKKYLDGIQFTQCH